MRLFTWRNIIARPNLIKLPLFAAPILAAILLLPGEILFAAEIPEATSELDALVARIRIKVNEGKNSAAELAGELKEFDALLARHQGENTDAVANILFEQAGLYLQVLEDFDKASQLIQKLKREFPRTKPGQNADKMLASIARRAEAKRTVASLVVGTTLPDFDEQDLNRKPLSIAHYKGKSVLLDFGATWSDAWVAEIPNVRRVYDTYHRQGLEIIGISLDQDEMKLSGFVRQHDLPWRHLFDGRGWGNKLAAKYGVISLPSNYLLDREGKIVARNVHGKALEEAVAKTVSLKAK